MARPPFCALPPLRGDVRVGRGFGMGYNRSRTAANQLHAGQDFPATAGTPVFAPVPGRVVFVSRDTGPAISAERAMAGQEGQVRGMSGYGNAVVVQHDFTLPRPTNPLPTQSSPPSNGLPGTFWTSYNHLSSVAVRPGQELQVGDLIGLVGNTTNRQFAGMGAHLHFEVRVRPFPGSYARDTVDPNLLWQSLGIELVGARREVQRAVGGDLMVQAGGPSDCTRGQVTTLAGFGGLGAYLAPAQLTGKYAVAVPDPSGEKVDEDPPDYEPVLNAQKAALDAEGAPTAVKFPTSGGGSGGLVLVAGLTAAWLLFRRR